MNRLTTSWGELELTRFPEDPRDPLRAWDAADEYLLRHLGTPPGSVVIVGDRWGALTTALAARDPAQISDSHLAQEATRANLKRNGAAPIRLLSTQDPPPARVDTLLIRVPKSLALLEDQLHRLAPSLHPESVVVGAGMVKEIHTSTLRLFETVIGPTRTTLAEKKARLILTQVDPGLVRPPNPWPLSYDLPEGIGPVSGRRVLNHAGVFCADRLDIGTRFFLRHLPATSGPVTIADLGCGNGVVGLSAALANPAADVLYLDESHQAVASARANAGGSGRFVLGDGLSEIAPGSLDLVLNNPPFHSHQATTDRTAWRMFTGARRALRAGGELWVIGNRHLGYHVKLRRVFGNCEVAAADPKFVVLRAVKR